MSRSGYSYDCSDWALVRWRGAVTSAIRGARGQKFLQELLSAMEVMQEKTLIRAELLDRHGGFCALGAVGLKRGINMEKLDPEDREQTAGAFGISQAMVAEIVFENDEGGEYEETPQGRWRRMYAWVKANIRETA